MPIDPRALVSAGRSRAGSLVDRGRALALLESVQQRQGAGVVHLDLDRFHRVNAQWGQKAGDRVLALLGPRLARRLPAGAVVAPLKGDSFLAVVPGADAEHIRRVADDLLDAVREPMAVDVGLLVDLRASAGVAWQPAGPAADLVEHAFLACRRAKGGAGEAIVGYEDALGTELDRRQQLEGELRRALAQGELRLFVQPEIDLHDGRVTGAEALIRWQHPTEGLLAPGRFLPDAERAGLMVAIGDWVVEEAIRLAAECRAARGGEPLRIWVNLAAPQLADGEPLCRRVERAIVDDVISARCIGFEVTESSLLEDLPGAVGVLQSLRELGVEIALDDFGTGYSSLSYLRQLPVTAVKIDQQFVAGIGGSLADEAIIEAVIDLAHALGLRVIAEGIEDIGQAEALIRMGADQAQGYHFGRPMPLTALVPLLDQPWCGAAAPDVDVDDGAAADRRADHLPGFGSPRARLLMAALDTARDSIIVTAAAGGDESGPPIVYVNAAFEQETGFRAADVIGRSMSMLLPDPPNPDVLAWFRTVHAVGAAATTEMPNRRADGSTFLCELTVSPVSDERGVHTHWLHVRRDLTDRRAAEGDRARFQGLIEQTTSLVFLAETGGQWVYANAAQRRAIGIPLDAPLDGVRTDTAFTLAQQRQIEEEVLPALQTRRTWQGTSTFVNQRTGERTEVEADVQYVDDPLRPGVRFFASVSRDVTHVNALERAERRRRELGSFAANVAKRALEQSRENFVAGLSDTLGGLAALVGADYVFLDDIDLDAGVVRPLGTWDNGRYGDISLLPNEVPVAVLPAWIERLSRGGVVREWRMDGAPWSAELRAAFPGSMAGVGRCAPLLVGGELMGVLGMTSADPEHRWSDDEVELLTQVADTLAALVDRHRAADALRKGEARVAALLANVSDLLLVIDRDGWIRYTNDRLLQALGLPAEDVIGHHFVSFVHPDEQDAAVGAFAMTLEGQRPPMIELRLRHADGTSTWYDADTSGVDDPIVGGYMISLRDVTAQRQQLEAAEAQNRLERVILSVSEWALEVRPDDIIPGLHLQLERVGRALGTDVAFAALLDGDTIHNVAGWSAASRSVEAYALPPGNVELPALVARYQTLEPLVVDDIELFEGDWVDEWRAFPVCDRAGLNVPLVAGGRCLGNLGVAMHRTPRRWRPEEVAFVRRISEMVGALIERHRVETSLRKSESRLAALLDASHDMVVVVGADGTITYTNRAVDRALGHPPDGLVGRHVLEVIHPDDAGLAMRRLDTLRGNEPTPMTVVRLLTADGGVGSWEITSGDLHEGIDGGRVLMARDVTARIEAESSARTWVELLRFAFDVAQMALDVDAGSFVATLPQVCRGIAEMLRADFVYVDQLDEAAGHLVNRAGWIGEGAPVGVQPGDQVALSEVPDWVRRLRASEPIVVDDAATADEPWVVEKRARMGPEASIMAMGMSSAGQLFGVLGCSMAHTTREWTPDEITFLRIVADTIAHVLERARLDEALRMSEARFRVLSETAADLVMLVDAEGVIGYASPSSVDVLGYTPDELVGRTARSIVHPDDIGPALEHVATLLRVGSSTSEQRLVCADGSSVWVVNSASAVIDPASGRPVEYRVSVRDISERKRLEEELARQVLHDPLTGLGNRMLLQSRLEAATGRRDPTNEVAVLLLDLDGFKQVNDTHGHAVGDRVLCELAERLQHVSRQGDTVARTGGDEFVLLCPETGEVAAEAVARRVVAAISAPVLVDGIEVCVGVSVGVAHLVGGAAEPDLLLIEADHAMYAAKRAGRGRVAVAPGHVLPLAPSDQRV